MTIGGTTMASTIYYGKSDTVNDGVYKVIVSGLDSTVTTESDFLSSGDILNVYFVIGCTVENPAIKLFNGDLNHEIATTGDSGNFIKIQSADVDLTGIWTEGEVCSLTYVETSHNSFYWYLSGASVATSNRYGRTKVAYSLEEGQYDSNASISAGAVLNLVNQQRTGKLSYIPNTEKPLTELIGTLKLLGPEEEELSTISIYIPQFADFDTFRTYTNELYNNGPKKETGEATTEANIGYGHPYITRIIPGSLTFTNSFTENTAKGLTILGNNNSEFIAYELSDTLGNSRISSQGNILITPAVSHDIVLNGSTEVANTLTLDDKLYCVLDINIDENTNQAISGDDMILYNNLLLLGWQDCM